MELLESSMRTPKLIPCNVVISLADEHLAELMPIFERLRAQEQVPCAFPLHMGAGGTAFFRNTTRLVSLSSHTPHCHPSTHWVSDYQNSIVFRSRVTRGTTPVYKRMPCICAPTIFPASLSHNLSLVQLY